MNSILVEGIADAGLCKDWDCFVSGHPDGTIFQTSLYFRIFEKQKAFQPVAVLLKDEAQNVTGVLSGIIQYQLTGAFKKLTSRCIVMGGPLVQGNDQGLIKMIIAAFDKYIGRKVIYAQFRNLFDVRFAADAFTGLHYKYSKHLNFLADLTRPEDTLWKDIHKQKRYEIRRTSREGLSFKQITTLSDLKTSYDLLSKIYKRIKLPVFPFQVFEKAFNILTPEKMAAFFGAYLGDKLIATMYTLCYNGRIYNYFAGADHAHYDKFPNSMIPWQVMLWGKSQGMTIFDWGGAGKPGVPYGVRNYKEKFGGQLVNYGRYEKIYKPLLFQMAKSTFTIYRHFK